MRIMFYISHIGSGGAARVMTILANQFSNNSADVYLVTNFQTKNEYFLYEKVKRLVLEDEESKKIFVKKNIDRIIKLRRMITKYKPDVLISFMHENDARAYVASRGLKIKLILSVRNDPAQKFSSFPIKQIATYIYSHADGVVFQTNGAKSWFKKLKGKSEIIYNPVDNVFYSTERVQNPRNIITTGKFLEQKNHMMLLKAFQLIADKTSENLVIYGDGKLRTKYEKYIAENGLVERVLLPGSVTNVENYLAKAKLFVMSSDYEGLPNSLMEAMALGVPCISTDCPCGGPRELMRGDLADNLVQCGDIKSLGNRILHVLNNDETLEIKERTYAEAFKAENIFRKWNEFICVVLG